MSDHHSPRSDVTELLIAWTDGDSTAMDQLIDRVHPELRRIAANHIKRERRGHSLQPTELVHEASPWCTARAARTCRSP